MNKKLVRKLEKLMSVGRGKKDKFNCDRCHEPITGGYASMGGNIEPYIPPWFYHITCIPTVKELLEANKV